MRWGTCNKGAEKRVKGRWPLRGSRGGVSPWWGTGATPLLRPAGKPLSQLTLTAPLQRGAFLHAPFENPTDSRNSSRSRKGKDQLPSRNQPQRTPPSSPNGESTSPTKGRLSPLSRLNPSPYFTFPHTKRTAPLREPSFSYTLITPASGPIFSDTRPAAHRR